MLLFQTLTQDEMTGYGGAASNLAKGLHQRGVQMAFHDLIRYYLKKTDADVEWIRSRPWLKPDIQIFFGQPYRDYEPHFFKGIDFFRNSKSLKVAPVWGCFTMFESHNLPDNWVDDINDRYKFDFLMTPSKWCKKIFEDAGVKCPVHYVPLGCDPRQFPYLEREWQKKNDRDIFVFLHRAFYMFDRKGSDLITSVWRKLHDMGELENAMLVLKTIPFVQQYKGDIDMLDPSGIFWLQKKLSHSEMLDMIRFADVGLHPTSGEGIGLMPMEEMFTGLPCAVSNNTGCSEYVDPEGKINFPINCFGQANFFRKIGGIEMRPDKQHLEELILNLYSRKHDLYEMGRNASKYMHENWTIDRTVDEFMKVVKQYAKI